MQRSHHPGLAGRSPSAGWRPEHTVRAELRDPGPQLPPGDTAGHPDAARAAHGLRAGLRPLSTQRRSGSDQGRRAGSTLASRALHAVPVPTLGGPTSHKSDGLPLDVVQVSACVHVAPELPLQMAHAPGCPLLAGRPRGRLSHWALGEDGPSV